MPTLKVSVSGFTGSLASINGGHSLTVSKRRCMRAATSVGLPMLAAASPSSSHAAALASYKALALKCAIDFSGPYLRRPHEYNNLDQTEKANISYWTGMTFAAIVAEDLLHVPRLYHAAAFRRRGLLQVQPYSRSLADIVGQDQSGQWHVIEAKGRQANPGPKERDKWKRQATTVIEINGKSPVSQSYSMARISRSYSVDVVDPPAERELDRPVTYNFMPGAVARGYYGPLVQWLSRRTTMVQRGGLRLVVKLLAYDPVDKEFVFVGSEEKILQLAEAKKEEFPFFEPREEEDAAIGSDGIAVLTSPEPGVS